MDVGAQVISTLIRRFKASWTELDRLDRSGPIGSACTGEKAVVRLGQRKKTHVYYRLAKIINENTRIGIAVAIPKDHWDATPEWIRAISVSSITPLQ